jgi:lipopolysaccharide/colanic/teichoic acid biosynthesis glycosyltransferase
MKARVDYDLAYLSDWSLAFDLAILARTISAVIRGSNAH